MIKNIIAPLQFWLLSQGRCVGCGKDLHKPKIRSNNVRISCECGRIYIYNPENKVFRRAKLNEI